MTLLHFDHQRGLMEQCYASVQRGRQGRCETADESATASKRGPDLSTAGDSCRHPLQLEEGLAIAWVGGSCFSEGSRGLGGG